MFCRMGLEGEDEPRSRTIIEAFKEGNFSGVLCWSSRIVANLFEVEVVGAGYYVYIMSGNEALM